MLQHRTQVFKALAGAHLKALASGLYHQIILQYLSVEAGTT